MKIWQARPQLVFTFNNRFSSTGWAVPQSVRYISFCLQASYLSATSHTDRKSCRVKSLYMKRFGRTGTPGYMASGPVQVPFILPNSLLFTYPNSFLALYFFLSYPLVPSIFSSCQSLSCKQFLLSSVITCLLLIFFCLSFNSSFVPCHFCLFYPLLRLSPKSLTGGWSRLLHRVKVDFFFEFGLCPSFSSSCPLFRNFFYVPETHIMYFIRRCWFLKCSEEGLFGGGGVVVLLVHNAIHYVPIGDGWREVLVRNVIHVIHYVAVLLLNCPECNEWPSLNVMDWAGIEHAPPLIERGRSTNEPRRLYLWAVS